MRRMILTIGRRLLAALTAYVKPTPVLSDMVWGDYQAGRSLVFRGDVLAAAGRTGSGDNLGAWALYYKNGSPETWADGTMATLNVNASIGNTQVISLAWLSDTELVAFHYGFNGSGRLQVFRFLWNGSAFVLQGSAVMANSSGGWSFVGGFSFASSQGGTSRFVEVLVYSIGSENNLRASTTSTTNRSTNASPTTTNDTGMTSGTNGFLMAGYTGYDWQHIGDGATAESTQPYVFMVGYGNGMATGTTRICKARSFWNGTAWSTQIADEDGSGSSNATFTSFPGVPSASVSRYHAVRYHEGKVWVLAVQQPHTSNEAYASVFQVDPKIGQPGVPMTMSNQFPVRLATDASGTYRAWPLTSNGTQCSIIKFEGKLYGVMPYKPTGSNAGVTSLLVVDMETGIARIFPYQLTGEGPNYQVFMLSRGNSETKNWIATLGGANNLVSMQLAGAVIS